MPRYLANKARTAPLLVALVAFLVALPAAASAAPEYRGVQLHSLWADSSNQDMDRELDLARDLGSNVVRVDIGWDSLEEGGKGVRTAWYLNKLDRFVAGANTRGMRVIATLTSSPCWASSAPATAKQSCSGSWWTRNVQLYAPTDARDYADIAAWVAARYGDALAAFEVWNEPNLDRFLKSSNPAADYARVLKAAYPAIKAARPGLPVLAGAIGGADRPFLEALYAQGIKGSFDGISIHPYNEWRDPADRWYDQWKQYTFLPGIEWVRQGQLAAGDSKPLWLTEFGWSVCSGGGWCVNQAQQASYLVKAFQILDTMDYVKAAAVYNLRDRGTDASDLESNWGLVRRDYTKKSSYDAVASVLKAPAPPAPEPTPPAPEPAPTTPDPTPTAPTPTAPAKQTPVNSPKPAPSTKGAKTVPKQPKKASRASSRGSRRLLVRVSLRRGRAVARGKAPRGRRLKMRVNCDSRRGFALVATAAGGRFDRQLGSARKLAGCRVTVRARVGQSIAAAAARIPVGVSRGTFAAAGRGPRSLSGPARAGSR